MSEVISINEMFVIEPMKFASALNSSLLEEPATIFWETLWVDVKPVPVVFPTLGYNVPADLIKSNLTM